MIRRTWQLIAAAFIAISAIGTANAAWVNLDMTGDFNADGIGNNASGVANSTAGGNDGLVTGTPPTYLMNTIDGGATSMQGLITQTALTLVGSGKGLPDNGLILGTEATNELDFDVQLAYRNSDDGNNAWRFLHNGTSSTINLGNSVTEPNPAGGLNPKTFSLLAGQNGKYDKLYVYAISTRGSSAMKVTLNYSDASTTDFNSLLVPDFSHESGNALWPTTYETVTGQEIADLIDGMARLSAVNNTTGAYTRTVDSAPNDGRAIFALGFAVDSAKTLTGFNVEYLGEVSSVDGTTGALTINAAGTSSATSGIVLFGASANAVAPPPHPGDFDSDGDVDGADFVAWQTHFPTSGGASLADGDADNDGDADGADFAVWQTNFPFTPAPGVIPVPEPTAVVLWLLGALCPFIRYRRFAVLVKKR